MTNQCRLCKKEKDEQQFQKNGRTLKSCEDCRLVVREAKFFKKQKKNDDSGTSSDDNTTEAHTLETVEETVEDVGVEETKGEPVPEPVQEPVPEPVQETVPDVSDVEENEVQEEVFLGVNKPTKTVLRKTKTVVVKEKNLPTTKRVRKPRAKKE